jgi:hypothetical protein
VQGGGATQVETEEVAETEEAVEAEAVDFTVAIRINLCPVISDQPVDILH